MQAIAERPFQLIHVQTEKRGWARVRKTWELEVDNKKQKVVVNFSSLTGKIKVFINDVFAFQSGHFDTRLNHSYLSGDTYYTFHNRFDGFDVKLDLGVNGYAAETGDRLSPYHPTLFTWLIGLLCLPMLLGGLRGGAVATYTAMVIVSISTDPTRKPAQRYALAFEWLLGGYILWTVVTGLCWVLLAAAVRS